MFKDLIIRLGVRAGIAIAAAAVVFFMFFSPLLTIITVCVTPFVTKKPAKYIADLIIKSDKKSASA